MPRFLAALLWLIAASPAIGQSDPSTANDLQRIEDRLESYYLSGSFLYETPHWWDGPEQTTAKNLLSIRGDGSWPDIDYSDTHLVNWTPSNHLLRLRRMAIDLRTPGSGFYLDFKLRRAIQSGVEYWLKRKPTSSNWWHRDVGQMLQLGPLLILMEDFLPEELVAEACTLFRNPHRIMMNRVWLAQQAIWRGCLLESSEDIHLGLDAIKEVVFVTTEIEGIQHDHSFRAHGPALYNGGYGRLYMEHLAFWMYISRDTEFEFTKEQIGIFDDLLLDGTQWMIRRKYLEFMARGREMTRAGGFYHEHVNVVNSLRMMAKVSTRRSEEYLRFVDHIQGKDDAALVGNQSFWRTDYVAHRREDFHVGLKYCTKRVVTQENANAENLQSLYMNQGAMTVVRRGDELVDVYPVWDWSRVPGVTAPAIDPTPPARNNSWHYGTTDFGGAVSDGENGVAGFDMNWNGAWGKKAWFFFGDAIVCLGADIGGDAEQVIRTSINQVNMRHRVKVQPAAGEAQWLERGERRMELNWAYHDGVGYVFPQPSEVVVKNEAQTGSWYEINGNELPQELSKDVFSLWIEHGVKPDGAEYQYIIYPAAPAESLPHLYAQPRVEVLTNTASIQAARHPTLDLIGSVFYQPGVLDLGGGTTIEVDRPCLLMIQGARNKSQVSVASPFQGAETVEVRIRRSNREPLVQEFELPSGGYAGSTVTQAMALPGRRVK